MTDLRGIPVYARPSVERSHMEAFPMRVSVRIDETEHAASLPYERAPHVLVDVACPKCGASAPVGVRGGEIDARGHDFEEARAFAVCCGAPIGRIRVTFSTIFGLEEDRAVLYGRCRVY